MQEAAAAGRVHQPWCPEDCFKAACPTSGSCNLSTPLLKSFLNLGGQGGDKGAPFRVEHSKVTHSLHYNTFQINPLSWIFHNNFHFLYNWVNPYCEYMPHLCYLFICWWESRLSPDPCNSNNATINMDVHVSLQSPCRWAFIEDQSVAKAITLGCFFLLPLAPYFPINSWLANFCFWPYRDGYPWFLQLYASSLVSQEKRECASQRLNKQTPKHQPKDTK